MAPGKHFAWLAALALAMPLLAAFALKEPLWFPGLAIVGVLLFLGLFRKLDRVGTRWMFVLGVPVLLVVVGVAASQSLPMVFLTLPSYLFGLNCIMRANPEVVRRWREDDLVR